MRHNCPSKREDVTKRTKREFRYSIFLKKKRDGTIMTQGCADGIPHRIYLTKDEASSLTVSIKAAMLSCAINTKKQICIASNILVTFLHSDMEVTVIRCIELY